MAWEDDIQKTQSILGDLSGIVQQGIGIFGEAKQILVPAHAQSPTPTPNPEPIAAKPIVAGGVSFDSPLMLLGIGIIAYLLLAR